MTDTVETVVPVEPVELPELRYEYQPKDEQGRKIGGVQVIKYHTQEELIAKFEENNVLLQRRLREEIRKNKTGKQDVEEIPAESPRFSPAVDLQPESLSADELIALARDISDPLKLQEVYRRLAKAEFGAEPEKIRGALTSMAKEQENQKIAQQVDMFLQSTPDYYVCKENWDTIYNWMTRYELDPIFANFKMAYERLSNAGILLTEDGTLPTVLPAQEPVVVTEDPDTFVVNPTPVVLPDIQNQVVPPAAPVQRIATSLHNGNTMNTTPVPPPVGSDFSYTAPERRDNKGNLVAPAKIYYGLKAIDAMPADEYRDRFNREPGFKERAEKILATRKVNPNQR